MRHRRIYAKRTYLLAAVVCQALSLGSWLLRLEVGRSVILVGALAGLQMLAMVLLIAGAARGSQ